VFPISSTAKIRKSKLHCKHHSYFSHTVLIFFDHLLRHRNHIHFYSLLCHHLFHSWNFQGLRIDGRQIGKYRFRLTGVSVLETFSCEIKLLILFKTCLSASTGLMSLTPLSANRAIGSQFIFRVDAGHVGSNFTPPLRSLLSVAP
jgi:hypothetical protein